MYAQLPLTQILRTCRCYLFFIAFTIRQLQPLSLFCSFSLSSLYTDIKILILMDYLQFLNVVELIPKQYNLID